MIRIVDGPPGSGKSYYMIHYLSNFFRYDSFFDEFLLKSDVLLIANVEGLRVKHLYLDIILKDMPVEQFFTVANFEQLHERYRVKNIVLLIDEAQKIFDTKYDNKDVMYFFQYHRHLGVDIIFGTQAATLLSRKLIPLCEYICSATPRSKSVVGSFSYEFKDTKGTYLYSKALRKRQDVFRAYKSMKKDEISKPKNALMHWVVVSVCLFLVAGLCFKSALAVVKGKSESARKTAAIEQARRNVSIPPSAASAVPVQAAVSSARVPLVVPASSPPLPDRRPLPAWYRYDVDRYYKLDHREQFVIAGRTYLPPVCRDYDRSSQTAVCRSSVVGDPSVQVGAHAETPAAGSTSNTQSVNSAPEVVWGGAGDNPQYVPRYHASGYNPSDWVKYSDHQSRNGRREGAL